MPQTGNFSASFIPSIKPSRTPAGEIIDAEISDGLPLNIRGRVAVRVPTDAECDDHDVQDRVRALVRVLLALNGRRRFDRALRKAAKSEGTVLLDHRNFRVAPADLSDDDYLRLEEWVRDWAVARPPHIQRRNREETRDRRRYVISLLRMALPREMSTLAQSDAELRLERTSLEPLDDWF